MKENNIEKVNVNDGFQKSSFCKPGFACVEVSKNKEEIKVRDSKNPSSELSFTNDEWTAFLKGVRKGEFDN